MQFQGRTPGDEGLRLHTRLNESKELVFFLVLIKGVILNILDTIEIIFFSTLTIISLKNLV